MRKINILLITSILLAGSVASAYAKDIVKVNNYKRNAKYTFDIEGTNLKINDTKGVYETDTALCESIPDVKVNFIFDAAVENGKTRLNVFTNEEYFNGADRKNAQLSLIENENGVYIKFDINNKYRSCDISKVFKPLVKESSQNTSKIMHSLKNGIILDNSKETVYTKNANYFYLLKNNKLQIKDIAGTYELDEHSCNLDSATPDIKVNFSFQPAETEKGPALRISAQEEYFNLADRKEAAIQVIENEKGIFVKFDLKRKHLNCKLARMFQPMEAGNVASDNIMYSTSNSTILKNEESAHFSHNYLYFIKDTNIESFQTSGQFEASKRGYQQDGFDSLMKASLDFRIVETQQGQALKISVFPEYFFGKKNNFELKVIDNQKGIFVEINYKDALDGKAVFTPVIKKVKEKETKEIKKDLVKKLKEEKAKNFGELLENAKSSVKI